MKKLMILPLLVLEALNAFSSEVLWAALDEAAVINMNGTISNFHNYQSPNGLTINAARITTKDEHGNIVALPLWVETYWETEFLEVCLSDEDGYYGMPEWSSQFNLGEYSDDNMDVVFELGYVDWDSDNPFITLAVANSTYGQLYDDKHTYESGSIAPPGYSNWMPTVFYVPVPEPSIVVLAMIGLCLFLMKRKNAKQV